MTTYLTNRLPHWLASHPGKPHATNHTLDGLKTTIIPPLSPPGSPRLAAGGLHAPVSRAPEHGGDGSHPPHSFGYDTLAHFLHTFHSHYGTAAADEDEPFGTTHPHFDLAEGRRGYVLYGELPGLKRDEVVVETDDHSYTVTVSGVLRRRVPGEVVKTAGEADEEEVHWHVGERRVGRFQRAFRFPVGAVDMDLVSASMQDGVLCAVVPKLVNVGDCREVTQPRKVEVRDGRPG